MSELPDVQKIIGVKVRAKHPNGPHEYVLEEIPAEALVEMHRRQLRPILTLEEAERKQKQFMLIGDFAVI